MCLPACLKNHLGFIWLSFNLINLLIPLIILFWNGQYYLMKHSLDYGKYLEIRRVEKLLWIEKNSPKYERNVISPKNERQALFT